MKVLHLIQIQPNQHRKFSIQKCSQADAWVHFKSSYHSTWYSIHLNYFMKQIKQFSKLDRVKLTQANQNKWSSIPSADDTGP